MRCVFALLPPVFLPGNKAENYTPLIEVDALKATPHTSSEARGSTAVPYCSAAHTICKTAGGSARLYLFRVHTGPQPGVLHCTLTESTTAPFRNTYQ